VVEALPHPQAEVAPGPAPARAAKAVAARKPWPAAAAEAVLEPLEGDESEAAAKRKRMLLIGGGAVAAVVLIVVVVLATRKPPAATDQASADTQKPAAAAATETAKTPPAEPKRDVEPAEPGARKTWLLAKYDREAEGMPYAFGELLERLDTLEKIDEKDNAWVAACQQRIRQLKQRAEKRAEEVAETAGTSAMKKADAGDYKGALAELDKFPADLSRTIASGRVFYFRKKLSEKAMELYQAAEKRAQQLAAGGDCAGAEKAFDAVTAFGHPRIDKLVAMQRAELKDFAARGKNPSEGKTLDLSEQQAFFRADIYACLPNMTAAFDAAYHESALGAREAAEEKIDLAQYPRSAVFYYCRAMILARVGAMEDARWCAAQAARLAQPNDAFRSRLLCLDSRFALFGGGVLETGIGKAQEALKIDPKNADGVFLMGIANMYLAEHVAPNHPQRAEFARMGTDCLKMAVRLDPQYARVVPKALAAEAGAPDTEKYKFTGSANPYLPAVALVRGRTALGEGEGTGFAVHSTPQAAYIVTNFHVIKGFNEFTVTYQQESFGNLIRKTSSTVKILATDPVNDLALLEVATEMQVKALPLRATTAGLTLPMKLTMIGHPKGLDFTVITGELANLSRLHEGRRHLQINSNVDCGMSGGPVIDETGHVIGVTVAKVIGLGQSLAILTEHVRDLCAKAGIKVELRTPDSAVK
jgi:S1-C subfamily serine protease